MAKWDHDDLKSHAKKPDISVKQVRTAPTYVYEEDRILEEIRRYIDDTYSQHYIGHHNKQISEYIASAGLGTGFFLGSVMKYAARYGKKPGTARRDLMKIIHYTILQLWLHDLEERQKTDK